MSPVPLSILTDRVIERVLTQGAFVGGIVQGEGGDTVMDDDDPSSQETESEDTRIMRSLYRRFAGSSKATDLSVNVPPQPGVSRGLGFVTLIVPGWIRERAAEVFFEHSDFGEGFGLPDAILGCLIKVNIA